jgi:hypothetical protein
MKRRKERLTVTIDRELLRAGHAAVASGEADSLSAWVNLALAERAEKERQRAAAEEAIADYEAEFGVMTSKELALQARLDRVAAIRVRARRRARKTA